MAYLTQFGTATTANTNLNTTTLVGTFTNTTRIRKLYINIFADQVKGGGDYKASITVQRAGAGVFYQSIITTNTVAAGVTSILFNSIAVNLNATDVMKVYLLGLSTDNDTTADVIVDVNEEWIDIDASGGVVLSATQAAYAPAKAGDAMLITAGTGAGQLSVTSGVISANVTQINGGATSGYNATLKLAGLDIQAQAVDAPAIIATGNGWGAGLAFQGGATGGYGIETYGGGAADGMYLQGGIGGGRGMMLTGTGTGAGLVISGGLTSGNGLSITTTNGDGINIASAGAGKYDINADIHGTIDTVTTATNVTTALAKLKKWLQLLFRKDAAIATDNAIELAEVNADMGTGAGAYANTTDSTEAIRDNMTTPPTVIAIADQVWDEAIAGHLGVGSTGAALNTISTGKITVVSPMAQDGLAVKLVRGDDYLNADGRALVWTDSGSNWPNLTGATVRFKWGIFTKTCTVIGAGGAHQQVSLDLTSAETNVLENGTFDIEATLSNTHIVTIVVAGSLIIREDV